MRDFVEGEEDQTPYAQSHQPLPYLNLLLRPPPPSNWPQRQLYSCLLLPPKVPGYWGAQESTRLFLVNCQITIQ